MSKYVPQVLKDAFPRIASSEAHEKIMVILGTAGSGKTTAVACLYLTCQALSQEQENFFYDVKEITIPIRDFPSKLSMGYFPPQTPPNIIGAPLYKSEFQMKWSDLWGNKLLRLPVCETAGEDMVKAIGRFERDSYKMITTGQNEAKVITEYVCKAQSYLAVAPAPRIIAGGKQLEPEPEKLSVDPDVNLARIFSAIFDYKKAHHSPNIESIGVLITKCDRIFDWAQAKGMDLSTFEGTQRFMNRFFRDTMGKLKFYGLEKVRFFPVFVETFKDEHNNPIKRNDGSEIIKVNEETGLPSYSSRVYVDLIMWAKEFLMK